MNSPLLALPNLPNASSNAAAETSNSASRNAAGAERANGDESESTSGANRAQTGIPGPLKSPLAAFHPYASGYNMNQALAAQASRILAARFANLPGEFFSLK